MSDEKKRQYPNEKFPATAISFKRDTLELLKRIADREERSLAAQVRVIIESWLQSPDGVAAIRKAGGALEMDALQTEKSAPPTTAEDKQRIINELRELLARYPELKNPGEGKA